MAHEGWTCEGLPTTTYLKYTTWYDGGKWVLDSLDFDTGSIAFYTKASGGSCPPTGGAEVWGSGYNAYCGLPAGASATSIDDPSLIWEPEQYYPHGLPAGCFLDTVDDVISFNLQSTHYVEQAPSFFPMLKAVCQTEPVFVRINRNWDGPAGRVALGGNFLMLGQYDVNLYPSAKVNGGFLGLYEPGLKIGTATMQINDPSDCFPAPDGTTHVVTYPAAETAVWPDVDGVCQDKMMAFSWAQNPMEESWYVCSYYTGVPKYNSVNEFVEANFIAAPEGMNPYTECENDPWMCIVSCGKSTVYQREIIQYMCNVADEADCPEHIKEEQLGISGTSTTTSSTTPAGGWENGACAQGPEKALCFRLAMAIGDEDCNTDGAEDCCYCQ